MKKAMQHSAIPTSCNAPACADTIVILAEENVDTLSGTDVLALTSNEESAFYCAANNASEQMDARQYMNGSIMRQAVERNRINNCNIIHVSFIGPDFCFTLIAWERGAAGISKKFGMVQKNN